MIWFSFQTLFRCVYYLQVVECVCMYGCSVAPGPHAGPEILVECALPHHHRQHKDCGVFSVVRQALMQNQAPEIQAKLLAMQRQIQQQQHVVTPPQAVIAKSLLTTPVKPQVSPATPTSTDASRTKKPLTQEQREDQMR